MSELVQQSFERTQMLNTSSVLLSGSDWEGRNFRCKMTLNVSFTAIWGYSRLRRVCLPGKNKWHVSLFKTSIGLHLRVILTGIWKNIIYYMYVRSLLTPWNSIVTQSQGGRSCAKARMAFAKKFGLFCRDIKICCDLRTFWKSLGK